MRLCCGVATHNLIEKWQCNDSYDWLAIYSDSDRYPDCRTVDEAK